MIIACAVLDARLNAYIYRPFYHPTRRINNSDVRAPQIKAGE